MKKTTPTRATGPLHFEDLDPHRFEDLVRRLIYDFRPWRLLEATGRSGTDGERDRLLLLWHNAAAFQVGRVSPGRASCMRHYGAGPCSGPDRM